MTEPLAGVRVIEICNVAAGPFCGMALADFGAEVIKVESPKGGDTMRAWPPHTGPEDDTYSENFASLNRNKSSIALDLKSDAGRNLLIQLAADADVLIENNRPGALDRLNLGFSDLIKVNPKLIFCSISAYGQTGPRSSEGGFDVTVQAVSGIMSVTGEPGQPPVKAGVPVSDFAAGLYAAFSIAAQLRRVAETGEGVHIDVPMMGTSLAISALQTSEFFGARRDPVRLGSAHPRNAPYRAFKAADEYFVMAAGTQSLWETVCHQLDRTNLLEDSRFATSSLRAKHQAELKEDLEQTFAKFTARDLIAKLSAAGVPCVPINTFSAAVEDPQTKHMGWVENITLPNGVKTQTVACPVKFNGVAPVIRTAPPRLDGQREAIEATLKAPR